VTLFKGAGVIMAIETVATRQDHFELYDTILELCFTGNEALWDRKSEVRKLLERLKAGEADFNNDGLSSPEILKATAGILLGVFCVFPGLTNNQLRLISNKNKENSISLMIEGGRVLKIGSAASGGDLKELAGYFKKKILGLETAAAEIETQDWKNLRDVFKHSKLRLNGEKTFLESLIKDPSKILATIANPEIKMDSLIVILSALPSEQLNFFFIKLSEAITEEIHLNIQDESIVEVKKYFSQSAVSLDDLFKKIRVLLILYASHDIIVDYVLQDKARELLISILTNNTAREESLSQLEKTVVGQYRPRVDIAQALAKLLS
jgi:hypothetical protein